jgi:hypothetical protein
MTNGATERDERRCMSHLELTPDAKNGQMSALDTDDDTDDISHSHTDEDDEERLPSKATTPIRNNAGVGVDWRALKAGATNRLVKLGLALSSCDTKIGVHQRKIKRYLGKIALHERNIRFHEGLKKN